MDTVNRYVSAASTALWGENTESQSVAHGDEPMSGVQGKGVANDPYDAGNREGETSQFLAIAQPSHEVRLTYTYCRTTRCTQI